MSVTLKAENIAIRYITGDFKDIGIKEYVVRRMKNNYHVNEFMAVNDVSFELEQGDLLGIIGTNGAGKSTLLKAIAGIMEPTRGKITAHGEVAALLELGSGFDGDLTVKENAYLRGAMLGYTQEFMDQTYDQIIEFAELREFEDRPFKQLSSGMKSRLAFSIASLVHPDILILDEVLSVGDGAFQEKSAKKMREIIGQGATTILVSHSLNQIRELCNKVLWLDHGRQIAFGETQEICDRYEQFLQGNSPLPTQESKQAVIQTQKEDTLPVKTAGIEKKQIGQILKMKSIPCMVLATCFAVLTIFGCRNLPFNKTQVHLSANTGSGMVTFRGAMVDGSWVNPETLIQDSANWIYDSSENVYTAVDESPMELLLPASEDCRLTFNAGPDEGIVRVIYKDETIELWLADKETIPTGNSHLVPTEKAVVSAESIAAGSFFAVLIILLIICCFGETTQPGQSGNHREYWLDVLKVVSAAMISVIHVVWKMYDKGPHGSGSWGGYLFLNTVTRCAVPLFIMISGILMLGKEISIEKVIKNASKAIFVLVFWNAAYILYRPIIGWQHGDLIQELLSIPVQQGPSGHLWYSYLLVWIYLFAPMLGVLYRALSNRHRLFFIGITTAIPGVLYLYQQFMGFGGHDILSPFNLYMTPAYMGMMFLGRFLYDNLGQIQKKWHALASIIAGLGGSMLLTYLYYLKTGSVSSPFTSETNLLIIIYSAGVLSMGYGLRDCLNHQPQLIQRLISKLAQVSLGVYFVHCMVQWVLPSCTVFGFTVSQTGSPLSVFMFAMASYGIAAVIAVCAKSIPGIRKLV